MHYLIIALLVIITGFFAGLILSYFGLDVSDLERKATLGNKNAQRILPLRKRSNQLLCTLMMCNVFINSAIASLMSESSGSLVTIMMSGTMILIFGDIVPNAICNRYKMQIAASTTPIVYGVFYILWPITTPIAYVLDRWLHVEMKTIYTNNEIQEIIKNHQEHEILDNDEKDIIIGGLSFSKKLVVEKMTPMSQVYYLDIDEPVTIEKLKEQNFARVPLYKDTRDNIVGILFLKDLVGVTGPEINLHDYAKSEGIIKVLDTETLDVLLNLFTQAKTHMSFVYDEYGTLRGIITFEDVLEAIIGRDILDESDSVVNYREEAKKKFIIETQFNS